MIVGDFNAHNPLWGSDKITDKGKVVKDVLSNLNFCILNDGSNTYLHPGNGSYSSIDLTIEDPSLLLDLHWTVHDDLCGSDHFPIIVEGSDPLKPDCTENWKLNKADWALFESLCLKNISSRKFECQ